jgi:hypothetical protein
MAFVRPQESKDSLARAGNSFSHLPEQIVAVLGVVFLGTSLTLPL